MSLLTNLVSYWKFDESSGNASDSKDGNTGINSGGTYGAGKINNGFVMASATTSSMSWGDTSNLQFGTGDFSLNYWLNVVTLPTGTPSWMYALWSKDGDGNGPYQRLGDGSSDNRAKFTTFQFLVTGNSFTSNSILSAGNWYMITVTRSSAGQQTIYVNGNQDRQDSGTPSDMSQVGADWIFGTRNGLYPNVKLDEAGMWNKVLTPAEVTKLYNGGSGLSFPFGVLLKGPIPVSQHEI